MSNQKRANELASIINQASKDLTAEEIANNGKVIKVKYSKSEWYHGLNGRGHEPSMYETIVLDSVVEEAKELQTIRKENQGNWKFNFEASSYTHVERRTADHTNADHLSAIELNLILNAAEEEAKMDKWLEETHREYEEVQDKLSTFKPGNKVSHKVFGIGTLKEINADNTLVIEFVNGKKGTFIADPIELVK